MYISIVESILTADEIERLRGFLGPVMRLSGRSEMKLSGKTVYGILTRSIVTVKKNEAWFHFAGQPMKFSIREFHMVTGLKCNGDVEGPRGEYEWDLLKGRTHKLSDVLNQLKKTRVDASDERVCLAMLLLVESILLPKNNKGTFPLEYVNKAKDMMYPWGRDAYLVLLRKCFSQDATEPATVIIETQVCTPVLTQQVGTEATNETPVSPIAPQSIETLVFTPIQTQQMVTEGTYDSTEPLTEIISATNKQVGTEATNERPVSPIAPQSIETPFFTPIQTQQMVTEGTYDSTEPLTEIISATNKEPSTEIISAINKQEDTHAVHNTPSSPVSSLISRVIEETHHLQTSASSPLSTLFENGADKVAVTLFEDQKRVTVTANKIRPKPPADDREKKFEMMDNVEAFYSKGWSSGQVRMILGENTFSTASRKNEANPDQTQQDTKEPMNETISQNISDTQRLTRARAKILREQNKNEEPRV
ncbi:unnamed protein product [Brassica oleracea var. botrytis]